MQTTHRQAILLACTSLLFFPNFAQEPVKKGEFIPNVTFEIRKGDSVIKSNLSDYSGQVLLIDFWGIHCLTCIHSMPKLLKLQNSFSKDLKILLVTENTKEEVESLWSKLEKNPSTVKYAESGRQLNIISGDKNLKEIFPHEIQPTYVWIDRDQRYLAMTRGISDTDSTLLKVIAGSPVTFEDEVELIDINLDDAITWLKPVEKTLRSNVAYSMLFKGIDFGRGNRLIPPRHYPVMVNFTRDTLSSRVIGINCVSSTIIGLYRVAYKNAFTDSIYHYIPLYQILIEGKDSSRMLYDLTIKPSEWRKDNTYSYSIKVPWFAEQDLFQAMAKDLDRLFNIESQVEIRNVKCFVLKKIAQTNAYKPQLSNANEKREFDEVKKVLVLNNMPMALIERELRKVTTAKNVFRPFFNDVGYAERVSIKLPWDTNLANVSLLKVAASLRECGLDLIEEQRKMKVLVIKLKP